MESIRSNQMKLLDSSLEDLRDLSTQIDVDGRTLIHLATLNNNQFAIGKLLAKQKNYLKKQEHNEQDIKSNISSWINQKDSQGNTSILLSAFVGNISVMELLMENGGELNMIYNNKGQTAMHLAAQGPIVNMLVYLREKIQLLPGPIDDEGTTPLHQACYHTNFNAAVVLLSWGVDINHKDNQGFTPLHVCALRGQNRIIKKLLYRGVHKQIRNHLQETPADVALKNNHDDVFNTLTTQKAKCQQTCVRMSVKPRKRTKQFQFAFLLLFASSVTLTIIFTLPFVKFGWVVVLYFTFVGLTALGFLLSTFTDPGYLPLQSGRGTLYELLQTHDFEDICAECAISKPYRSKHCEFCQRCVIVYDHHCPWIDNCIGARNHFYFLVFVISLFVSDIITICLNLAHVGCVNFQQEQFKTFDISKANRAGQIIAQIFVVTMGIAFLMALGYILYVQINNLLLDQTTFERLIVGKVKRGNSMYRSRLMSRHSIKENPKMSDKSIKNCFLVCFQNQRIVRYRANDQLGQP